jgi:hypothetical protein
VAARMAASIVAPEREAGEGERLRGVDEELDVSSSSHHNDARGREWVFCGGEQCRDTVVAAAGGMAVLRACGGEGGRVRRTGAGWDSVDGTYDDGNPMYNLGPYEGS